jgi:predicted MFS family arabinose efflux permease
MFFFLTIFVQEVWGYSSLKTGIAYLPMVTMIMVASGVASQLVARIGARPLLLAGSAISTGGMFWLSRINEHSHYASGLLGPMLVTAFGMGLIFVPMSLVALVKVANNDTGVASSLLNTGQQVGGSIGLAILGTVAWSAVASSIHTQVAAATAAAKHATVHLSAAQQAAAQKVITDHAYSTGFAKGYLVSAGIALLALIITVVAIRVKREDLAGVNPMAAPID